jgi:hypothetical protein
LTLWKAKHAMASSKMSKCSFTLSSYVLYKTLDAIMSSK